ncbi:FAD-dependent monooxygenase [Ideonella livida]|uniref:2-octaprenyl-3-methyl-6-methoxy-1,4-benzoquinol hydroxylase n=1 Tax=Ideonella livida TaxID=2707176 RepID=A0A7C9PJA1_9BURK|nr:FAD-dependent monooxygenase [Ideonella livida]NDY92572.1 2-octaprenyl-3-methyl-6-methoxy-1,4-benzoquinol hydroxylase [Ideonella livida]
MSKSADVRILGSGIVSRSLALCLAHQGLQVALQARPAASPRTDDVRAYALNPSSVALLQRLRAWDALPAEARTAVLDMKVAGDAPGAGIEFSAWQQAVDALAWIVDAAELENSLETAVRYNPRIDLQPQPGPAALTVVAEGKASAERERLGVAFERHGYGHSALATRLVAEGPHQGTAWQWFRAPEVLALLPLDRPECGHGYALVWSQPAEQAEHWRQAAPEALEEVLLQLTGGVVGRLRVAGDRATWPLALGRAQAVSGPGWALVGDAAHVVHPLAGQGLNLGLADVQALDEVLAARESWRDLGDAALLRRYARKRAWGTWAMAQGTDGLWQLFAQDAPGLRELRNHGMTLVNRIAPLKRWLVRQALDV